MVHPKGRDDLGHVSISSSSKGRGAGGKALAEQGGGRDQITGKADQDRARLGHRRLQSHAAPGCEVIEAAAAPTSIRLGSNASFCSQRDCYVEADRSIQIGHGQVHEDHLGHLKAFLPKRGLPSMRASVRKYNCEVRKDNQK
jgi:hypothetical protein